MVNIFTGGSYQGFVERNTLCSLPGTIFIGGSNDGFGLNKVSCPGTVFSGGSSDGFSYNNMPCVGIYFGGSGDGFASNLISCSASVTVFLGGPSDGFATSLISCPASVDVFKGGSSDGFGTMSISCSVPDNIFVGNSYQGFAFSTSVCPQTVNVFTGGSYNGFTLSHTNCVSSVNIYYGGVYPGFALSKIECASTIYSGGANDGFVSAAVFCSGIFSGGSYDGFINRKIECSSPENVFKGGSYDGFNQLVLNCVSPSNIFSGFSNDGFSVVRAGCSPGGGVSLPVELIYFKARCENKKVSVTWSVASQVNNNYFTVERSPDGINFNVVGIIEGNGNSSQLHNYSFVDADPLTGTSYYRLKQTDFDGQSEHFNSVTSMCSENSGTFSIYPNPNNGRFFIDGVPLNSSVVITNLVGEKVYDSKIKETRIEIILENQSNGIYFVHVTMDKEIITQKIILTR
jgi:hypothetical protein